MTQWFESENRLRRFLRDPESNIWTTAQLIRLWNTAQNELAQKTGLTEKVRAFAYPPRHTWAYLWDFEYQYTDGDRKQVLVENQNTAGEVVCYPWEPAYLYDGVLPSDDGTRIIHPFEAAHCSPADIIPVLLHNKFRTMKFCAFDLEQLNPTAEKDLSGQDPHYRTTSGSPTHYYRPDEYHNELVVYPRPASIVIQDEPLAYRVMEDEGDGPFIETDGAYAYCYDWEFGGWGTYGDLVIGDGSTEYTFLKTADGWFLLLVTGGRIRLG